MKIAFFKNFNHNVFLDGVYFYDYIIYRTAVVTHPNDRPSGMDKGACLFDT